MARLAPFNESAYESLKKEWEICPHGRIAPFSGSEAFSSSVAL
jgi:hypothetical protein